MSDCTAFTMLVVAKAPVPGLAKTRLSPPLTYEAAADVAAAALLDTLRAASGAVGDERARIVISMTGDTSAAARRDDLMAALRGCHVVDQRGAAFGERLANAHEDAAAMRPGFPVVQIGMDTPQASPALLREAAAQLGGAETAVLGEATDGGWWLLALADPLAAAPLSSVPMSRADTGRLTREVLESAGLKATITTSLTDVDTWGDAIAVAADNPHLAFATSVQHHQTAARSQMR